MYSDECAVARIIEERDRIQERVKYLEAQIECNGCGRKIENPVFLCLDCVTPKDIFLDDVKGFAMEKIMVAIMASGA